MIGVSPSALPDLLRAISVLHPEDDAGTAAIARLLGIEVFPLSAAPSVAEFGELQPPVLPIASFESAQDILSPRPGQVENLPFTRDREVPSVLALDSTERPRVPNWLETVEPFPTADDAQAAAPLPEPLLNPLWVRGVLVASAATLSEAGPL